MKIEYINQIREFNRFYTNILGIFDEHILNSKFSLAEARILYELNELGFCKPTILSAKLAIDKGYLSRILAKLENEHLISKKVSESDNRVSFVGLTQDGIVVINDLIDKSNNQLKNLLSTFSEEQNQEICNAMEIIKKHFLNVTTDIIIRDFKNDDIDFIISRQINLYKIEYGFVSKEWENYVSKGVKSLVKSFDPKKDCILILEANKIPSGCIAITHTEDEKAQLRFFFIEPTLRGIGAGKMLMNKVISFCKKANYKEVILWTCNNLFAARHLYEKFNFKVIGTKENDEWGEKVIEECWSCNLKDEL